MPASIAVDNKFVGGLKTDFTGLNFPENCCTATSNCTFDFMGNITRRRGFDYETNSTSFSTSRTNLAISSFVWTNVDGDGNTKILVVQIGPTLYFYRQTDATVLLPLSTTKLASTITLSTFSPSGAASSNAVECQYSSGNGFLFVFHPNLEPFYCTYNAGTITGTAISVQIRDFTGVSENVSDNFRPTTLTAEHEYNLYNQGWTNVPAWSATSSTNNTYTTGAKTWTVEAGLTITPGDVVTMGGRLGSVFFGGIATGTVTSYVVTTLQINITSLAYPAYGGAPINNWTFEEQNAGLITTWNSAAGNYPSNADVWWNFKNSSGVFDPSTTIANVTLSSAPAPKGSSILPAFDLNRTASSGVAGITTISTAVRPRTGCWFQGRVWYAGVDASFQATGNAVYTTWTENIYFSQIIEKSEQFGKCYELNAPTSETLFDLLPTDGGVITIQGCGSIYKLFSVQNGLLVFAANGIWFITGSQGIGFQANDYTITRVSAVQSISSTSFVDVLGYPVFWNEEGIYTCAPGKQGGSLDVTSLTTGSISSFFETIPLTSKRYARGVYNPLDYTIQWIYTGTEPADVTGRYEFDSVLNFNTSISSFFPWTLTSNTEIHGINYIVGPGGSTSPSPCFKYLTSFSGTNFTFSEEKDLDYIDWSTDDYVSYFITGYRIPGQGSQSAQAPYLNIYGVGDNGTECQVQSVWDYYTTGNSGRWSTRQHLEFGINAKSYGIRKIRTRGRGRALQLKFTSVSGKPMSLIGWSIWIATNEIP